MDGKDYVARVRLSTRTDETLADEGQSCAAVPAESLPWLLEQGLIAMAEAPAKKTKKGAEHGAA